MEYKLIITPRFTENRKSLMEYFKQLCFETSNLFTINLQYTHADVYNNLQLDVGASNPVQFLELLQDSPEPNYKESRSVNSATNFISHTYGMLNDPDLPIQISYLKHPSSVFRIYVPRNCLSNYSDLAAMPMKNGMIAYDKNIIGANFKNLVIRPYVLEKMKEKQIITKDQVEKIGGIHLFKIVVDNYHEMRKKSYFFDDTLTSPDHWGMIKQGINFLYPEDRELDLVKLSEDFEI